MSERAATADAAGQGPSSVLITVLAIATGALIANLYYAQPLVASIGPEIGIDPGLAGSVVSVTQIGYGLGLFLLVSLADIVENRKLVLVTLGITALGLVGVATSTSAIPFFAASFLIGLCSTGAQVLLPFVAHLVPAERRGRVVGNVMAGVLTGIIGGAVGSVLGTMTYHRGGWTATAAVGGAIGLAALLLFALETRGPASKAAGGH
jgi:predicted MFS family arabinose efflux permease